MKELKCPNCQHVFKVDEDLFESLANQVRNAAFDDEVCRRTDDIRQRISIEFQAKAKEIENNFSRRLSEKDMDLVKRDSELRSARERLESLSREKEAEFDKKIAASNV